MYNIYMQTSYTREHLNTLEKDALIEIVLSLSTQLTEVNRKMDILLEQIAAMNVKTYGRKSETILDEQLSIFNEAEYLSQKNASEPEIEEIVPSYKRRKHSGKRDEDLSGFPVRVIEHGLDEETLSREFPKGFTRLADEVYRKLEYHPATHEVLEHHIAIYKDKSSPKIIRTPHPVEMLDKSIATPSLAAGIMNGKYSNAMPLYRIEQELERNDVHISRQVMANWMIVLAERYLSLVSDRMKRELIKSHVIHADETPVKVVKDGREGMHNSYMWVYRSGTMCKAPPVIIYDYQKTRKKEHPKEFLKGFHGKLVCDGYQVYHSLEKSEETDFTVAGCWTHARRDFSDAVKAIGKDKAKGTLAYDALVQIANIYHTDNSLAKLPPSERKKKRRLLVKPLVDGFFDWLKDRQFDVMPKSKTGSGISYCLEQEPYLRAFLDDPMVPLDNNPAEQAIRSFCVGRKNWVTIDTVHGADSSAVIYSIVETAKANDLKVYEYLKYLLEEIPRHMEDMDLAFLDLLLPWSKDLPDICRKMIPSK